MPSKKQDAVGLQGLLGILKSLVGRMCVSCECLVSEQASKRVYACTVRAGKAGPRAWESQPDAIYALAIGDILNANVLQQRGR